MVDACYTNNINAPQRFNWGVEIKASILIMFGIIKVDCQKERTEIVSLIKNKIQMEYIYKVLFFIPLKKKNIGTIHMYT